MNILIVLNFLPEFGGGICKHLTSLGKLTKEKNHRLYLAFPAERSWQKDLMQISDVIIIPEIINPIRSGYSKVINSYCKKYSIDIMHIHFTFAQPFALALSFRKWKIPTVYHWHNPPVALNKSLTPENNIRGIVKRNISGIIARFTDNRIIDKHISISKEITQLLTENNWTIENKISFIPNGVELQPFEVLGKNKISDLPVIGTVANFRPQKDHETLVKACKILFDEGIYFELWLVGDGPTKPGIEKLTKDLRIQTNVRFWGTVLNTTDVYKKMDVFVLSTHYEGHPLVALEAMSYSLPIVATRIPSVQDVIKDNSNGLLFNPRDSDQLASILKNLLEDKNLFARFSQASLDTVKSLPTLDDWAGDVLKLYEDVLKRKFI